MKLHQRLIACVLVISMIMPMLATRAQASNLAITGDPASGFTILNDDGTEQDVDESWVDNYPYGIFALGNSQMVVAEGGDQQVLSVYRLGGTTNKASAIIYYQPAVVKNADGSYSYSTAISAEDITIKVEDPLPITDYQPWGMDPDPEETEIAVKSSEGTDGQGKPCTILSLDTASNIDNYQWYSSNSEDDWQKVVLADGAELPVGDTELETYDFRCVFTIDGTSYCTDSYKGISYVKPEAETVPEAPADIELNPDPTYTELDLKSGDTPYSGWYFEVCFADGEYKKDIIISANDDTEAELDKYAAITITDCIGGQVLQSLNTLMLRAEDNDGDSAVPSQVGFDASSASFDKSQGSAKLTVKRTGGTTKALSVDWALEDGSAKAGIDYVGKSGKLYFYGDQTEQTIEIELINDKIENLDEKAFTVRLSNLLGDDKSSITSDTCTVGLFNTNTASNLNLASSLYDVDAVDVSSNVAEGAGANVSSGTITGSQVTSSEGLGTLSDDSSCTVDWGDDGGLLNPQLWTYGRIAFNGGNWGPTSAVSMSINSDGGDSTTKSVANMGKLYRSIYALVYGGAKFASGWNRTWHGDEEYAYTYFCKRSGGATTGYWNCSPNFRKSGLKVYLSAYNPFTVSNNLDYSDSSDNFALGVAKYDSCCSSSDVNASTTVTLTRRTFNKDFYLNIYTANDSDINDVAKYTSNNYNNIIQSIQITEGGTSGGRLYEGSTIKMTLGNTHMAASGAYIVDSNGTKVFTGSVSGKTVTFSNIMLPPDGTYTFRLVLERTQNIKIDVTTSSEVDPSGQPVGGAASANTAAYNLLLSKNTAGGKVTVGYTPKSGDIYSTSTLAETQVSVQNHLDSTSGVITTDLVANIQYINFNLTEKDVILFNGKSYAGNETIWLETKHLTPKDLTFYFYEENYLTAERPMKATIDSTSVYFDGNGNGKIDGYFDEASGIFVTENGDSFASYLDDGDYEETQFQPVVEGGIVHQYFMRPYYTANPVCLVIPQGSSESERMQVMPNFITDVTNSSAYESLTPEQKQYRTIISGISAIKRESTQQTESIGYTSDNHYKYTEAASVYSYIDMPLGGDKSPSRAVTSSDLGAGITNGEFTKDNVKYMLKDGLAYYYSTSAPSNLGNAVYTWSPNYLGNLLYSFDSPDPIYIANSLAGSRIPITSDLATWYLKTDGSWTKTAPTDTTKSEYSANALGSYTSETRAGQNGCTALNNYLGAFGSNDTFALVINEQSKTTGDILNGLGTLEDTDADAETITRGTVGAFPNSEYLKQNSSNGADTSGDSSGEGSYDEFSADVDSELFSFNSEALSLFSVETDGYEVSFSIGIPVYSKDNGGGTGSSSNTFDDTKETAGKVKDFIKAIKDPKSTKKDAFKKLAGEDLDANKLKSKSIEFTVEVSLAITLKYNPLDNKYMFSEAALAVSVGIEVRLQYRFTPVPILYVYAQFNAEVSVSTGLGQKREAVIGDVILQNKEVKLYESPAAGQNRQYYFTSSQKAFNITFSGKLYMECYEFADSNGNSKYDAGESLGDTLSGFSAGYISSDGKDETEIVLKGQDEFALDRPVVVVLTVMDDGKSDNNAQVSITAVELISGVKQDLFWSGFHFEIEGSIELGIGIGIEIAKAEIYAKASLGIAFTLGAYDGDGKYSAASFDEFTLAAGIGFRVVFLFFNYEMDLIEYHLKYDGEDDKWTHGWSALGGTFGGDSDLGTQDYVSDGKVHVYITPPSQLRAQAYGNNVTYQDGDADDLAYTSKTDDFQVSGYGSSVNAFKLLDNVATGYNYQIVTVGDNNYVVYTGTRDGDDVAAVDNTQLMLSKLLQNDDTYGFVNPIAGNSTSAQKAVSVDNDDAGDLDFHAWAEGNNIHVIWVSYSDATDTVAMPTGDPYSYGGTDISKDNYSTISKPQGGIYDSAAGTFTESGDKFIINGQTMSVTNYSSLTMAAVASSTEPIESDYYTTAVTAGWNNELDGETMYYFPSSYSTLAEAQQAFTDDNTKYQHDHDVYEAYLSAKESYDKWISYYKWYYFFSMNDIQNQITASSRNTVVRHAVFNTADTATTGFSAIDQVSDPLTDTYYFMPVSAGNAAAYAQSVPYSEEDLEAQLQQYKDYLDDVITSEGSDGSSMSQSYIDATKTYRMNYQQSMLSVYGGNSRLTITAPDGTAYANGVMYVSKHQENGYGEAQNQTNEILTNISMTKVDQAYYVSYVTQQNTFEQSGGEYTDMGSISRLYLRSFTIAANDDVTPGAPAEKIVWGDPYLLRTVVNYEQDSTNDGVYDTSLVKKTSYTDPYLSNINFLTGKLGDKLVGTSEDFEPFGTAEEAFLLFEMNGNTYVIDQDSLVSITDPAQKTGTIYPFFTYQQLYKDALDENSTENLSSGKNEVIIGTDGDQNVAAIYTGSVPNSVNNAIYIAYWDPENGAWSDGVMLAMNYMDVYEKATAEEWDSDTTEAAYFDESLGGGMTQFSFSNLQIALGRSQADSGGVDGLSTMDGGPVTQSADSASSAYSGVLSALGLPTDSGALESLGESYSQAEIYALSEQAELLGADTGSGTASSSELLILTQGSKLELQKYEPSKEGEDPVIAPKRDSNGIMAPANVGIYAISYGKGNQQVGSASVRFAYNEFSVGSQLHANVSFKNVGDAAIRGSVANPSKVQLRLYDLDGSHDMVMAQWNITQNIGAGQTVSLSTTDSPCSPLATSLGTGDYFYITVTEDKDYIGDSAYSYDSSSDDHITYTFDIADKPEMGIENFSAAVKGVENDGDAAVSLSFDVTNRGSKKAEEAYVQLAYVSGYDADGNEIYAPLDLSDSQIYVSQQKLITDSLDTLGTDDLAKGIIYLGTDPAFYTDDYYISADKYNAILSKYYSLSEVSGWESGTYQGVTYWYNKLYHISAYAAYTEGQAAVKGWSFDSASGYYYNNSYATYLAAKAAADTARRAEYIITKAMYEALSADSQSAWIACTDNTGYYVPAGYGGSYAAAEAAYNAALADNSQDIISNYCRSVKGTVNVSPDCFNGKLTGSLDIRVKVFSKTSNASYDASTGLYSSEHSDEYYNTNNQVTGQIEQASFVSASPRITLALGSTHRLPVSVRTTTGEAPSISVVEVEDGAGELSTLYYLPDTDTDNVVSTSTGSIVIVGNKLGSGVIHVIDSITNTTYPITYTVAEAGDGTNIYNDDTQFTFYNANGSTYDEGKTGQSWKFQSLSSWTDALAVPYLGNLAIGESGSSFTFETKASTISFNMIGSATITSSKFPGTFTVSNDGQTAPPETAKIDFGNDTSVSHIVTVTVTGGTAYFDTLKLEYSSGYTPPSDDLSAPGIYWSRSFPTQSSVQDGQSLDFTVYAVDDSGLQSLMFNGSSIPDAQISKLSDSVWSYNFTVTNNTSFNASATDTNGNTTSRPLTVDWFTASPAAPEYGLKPALTASAYKVFADSSPDQDLFENGVIVVMTPEDKNTGNKIMLKAATDNGAILSYYCYDKNTASFVKMESAEITRNGYYMVKADSNNSFGTWSSMIFAVDCFEDMPEIEVTKTAFSIPNRYDLDWVTSKSAESTAKLKSITANGLSLSSAMGSQATTYSGKTTVYYGGTYTFRVTDTKDIYNIKSVELKVPVDISRSGIFTVQNPWTQPNQATTHGGFISVNADKITGGEYTSTSAQSASSLGDYHGSYEAVILKESEYEGNPLPGDIALQDGADSWLTSLSWSALAYDGTIKWPDLKAAENGEGKYIVIIRDSLNPTDYSTMAVQEITLTDNAVDYVSLSSRLASSHSSADGEVYISADKGLTGTYEFAVLPLEVDTQNSTDKNTVYKSRTAEDFKAADVKWQLSDWDSDTLSDAALSGLGTGWYQVAIRSFFDGSDTEVTSMKGLNALGLEADNARKAVTQVTNSINSSAASMSKNISEASDAWRLASENAVSLKAVYDTLYAKQSSGDTSVTVDDVNTAYDNWQAAITPEADARTAYLATLTGATEQEKTNLESLRSTWMSLTSDDEKNEARKTYESAVSAFCLAYQTSQFSTALTNAQADLDDALDAYHDRANVLSSLSAQSYVSSPDLWDGMLTGDDLRIYVGSGMATSLRAVPIETSQWSPDGQIIVNAMGGSAYDGSKNLHYQFAIQPITDKKSAIDYTGKMADIADLNLNWQFADDLTNRPNVSVFKDLGSGWYQVFVRTVVDPDIRDAYDVNTNLYDASGQTTDLATLRAAYDAASEAAEAKAITTSATKAHSLYLTYQTSQIDADYQAYIAAIGNDPDVVTALESWINTADKTAKKTAYATYFQVLKTHFAAIADASLYAASYEYTLKLNEITAQVEQAYSKLPGNYDTASYTIAYVAVHTSNPSENAFDDKDISYSGNSVSYTTEEGSIPLPSELAKILSDNKTLTVHLKIGDRQIVIPSGSLNSSSDITEIINNFTGGSGNAIEYTDSDGNVKTVPVSLVDGDTIAYVYMGAGSYRVVDNNVTFDDTAGHWAKDSIAFTANLGLFRGVTEDSFAPESTMTRAMLVTALYRMIGEPSITGSTSFTDVDQDCWYTDAVKWAYENGIVNGMSDTLFAPDQAITRSEMVSMLYRFMNASGFDAEGSADLDNYPDNDSVPSYASNAFEWAVASGIIEGNDSGRLSPANNATRAEVATVFERIIRSILK
ncbi:MAG: S-layer homology domain-containing protein [Clostridiaceae bacterium]|nr:S-layer homology domain-containing protein [Clostridiaceae bacterium]